MSRSLDLSLTEPQAAFALDTETRFPAIVAGFGSGKTESLVNRLLIQKLMYPKGWVGYYAPTYDLVSKIALPRLEELLTRHNLAFSHNKNDKIMRVHGYGAFIFRTLENPDKIIGYEHADAGIDELDTLKEAQAEACWTKIIARNRQKKLEGQRNTIAVATTPEGFKYVYKKWYKEVKDGYKLYRATTYSNLHNLPSDYIETLEQDYPPQLLAAYLRGEFVNLTSGAVYPEFSRTLNSTTETIKPGETVHIGLDFNVYKMAAVAFVIRDKVPYAIGELTKLRDTPTMIEAIKTKFGNGRLIYVYPDPAGAAGSSKNASVSDIVLLRAAGFNVNAMSTHPPVKDRVAAVNALVLNAAGQRRLKVNIEQCPEFTNALEQQVYDDTGSPDKKSGLDHVMDASGYFMYRNWPVGRFANTVLKITGI